MSGRNHRTSLLPSSVGHLEIIAERCFDMSIVHQLAKRTKQLYTLMDIADIQLKEVACDFFYFEGGGVRKGMLKGKLTCGRLGIVGSTRLGNEGICVLGIGGNPVGCGKVSCGGVGREGSGGIVVLGRGGNVKAGG